jgi:high frequency lysogenization protein
LDPRSVDQTLALAGVFQCAAMVQQLARTGSVPQQYYSASIKSIFNLDPKSVEDVYKGIGNLSLGIDVLYKVMKNNEVSRNSEAIRYSVSLLHLEKLVRKHQDMLSILRSRLENAKSHLDHFEGITHSSVIAKLAGIYVDTLGSFQYRIQVMGEEEHLQREDNANKVRAIFLAGVRSAILWRQIGGNRLKVIFGKSRIVKNLDFLKQQIAIEP